MTTPRVVHPVRASDCDTCGAVVAYTWARQMADGAWESQCAACADMTPHEQAAGLRAFMSLLGPRLREFEDYYKVVLRERDDWYGAYKLERERTARLKAALRAVVRHEPWPGDTPSERDFNEARKLLEE